MVIHKRQWHRDTRIDRFISQSAVLTDAVSDTSCHDIKTSIFYYFLSSTMGCHICDVDQ